jgi:predicted small secreted protein
MFKRAQQVTFVVLTAVLLGACNHAKNPSDVAKDVNAASQDAAKDTANAEEKAAAKVASAEKDVSREQRDAQHTEAVQEENVAKTDAEGRRKLALAKCEAFSGDRQQACKDEANASYDMAIARAKQERSTTDPKQR